MQNQSRTPSLVIKHVVAHINDSILNIRFDNLGV